MRVCSFLPSATEIVAELGFVDSLVGVSDECRWPPEVVGKPVVTAARIDPTSMSSLEIDEAVRSSVLEGRSLYTVDAGTIDALAPDLIVTQDLCTVCAVSSGQLESACPVGADVLSLDPRTLEEVAESVRVLATRLGAPERGHEVATRMLDEIDRAAASVRGLPAPARVLRRVDRPAVLGGTLAARDDRARRGRGRPRPARAAVVRDELGGGAGARAGAGDRRGRAASGSRKRRRERPPSTSPVLRSPSTATPTTRAPRHASPTASDSSPICSTPKRRRIQGCLRSRCWRFLRLAGLTTHLRDG